MKSKIFNNYSNVILSSSKDDRIEKSNFDRLIVTKVFNLSVILFLLFFTSILSAQPKFSEMSVKPGAFSRMGFGPRGIGMGNGLSSLTEGNLVAYYNPASSVFQEGNSFQTGYSFLSLDRALNFINFTRRFEFRSSRAENLGKPASVAGISAGIINSGVSKIDRRDNNGLKTKELSTSENLFFLAVANKFSDKFALGLTIKLYYYKLYESVTSTGVGFDIGAIYKLNENFNFSFMIVDLNSKYKWDTSPIYGQQGLSSENEFPLLKKIGIRYNNPQNKFLIVAEFENSNVGTNIIKFGGEYNIYEGLFLRAGVDQFNLSNSDWAVKPAAGFSYLYNLDGYLIGIDYAFMLEPYSSSDRHIIGVNFNF
ncbi:Hypothetical protein IALB_1258 [Ignavibacterium album JCM 16511]|uniref:PorV/PorQ family protein n=1 Tax=Ignavibacterium album (strain DSM 19864 / JCM 16511 / NBRC 101810 / Mat9-16) TaxID=945713 RepID=I0AJ11_IGNAJ|nr:hypothetical protein [Ignavibacterium album]AFH48968.1 Hypothetical protein IALB_1258 [Ignavibacterium album JCM 16511]